MRALSWNLFHGRDAPPGAPLHTWRSRLLRVTETDATHAQLNRPLLEEFATVLARDAWDVALLQEAPPRWLAPLCRRLGAHGAIALTSRNLGAAARAWLADRNPDLLASNEGGSNQILVRPPWRVVGTRRLTLTWWPERRRMLWASLEAPDGARLAAATLHATARDERAAARDVELAADRALRWAEGGTLLFGGDLNLRPRSATPAFDRLRERFGLTPPSAAAAVDHLFVRGLARQGPPRLLEPDWRELVWHGGRRIRLSDHAPVALDFDRPSAERSR
jgi:endonuclease/exonuclease/phosphatase family metal-dependent hydrolase